MALRSPSLEGLTRSWFIDPQVSKWARGGAWGFVADWRDMRVVVDATPLLVRSAGVKNYLYHWILHLRRAAGSAAVGTFPAMERGRALDHENSMADPLRTFSGLAAPAISHHTRAPLVGWVSARAR